MLLGVGRGWKDDVGFVGAAITMMTDIDLEALREGREIGFIGADGMIGPGPVIATGSAFAIKARGSKQVVVNFGGDGTYATPHFHATLNNAALLKLPFIYVLENNLYHQYAHYSYSCPMKDIADAAKDAPELRAAMAAFDLDEPAPRSSGTIFSLPSSSPSSASSPSPPSSPDQKRVVNENRTARGEPGVMFVLLCANA